MIKKENEVEEQVNKVLNRYDWKKISEAIFLQSIYSPVVTLNLEDFLKG